MTRKVYKSKRGKNIDLCIGVVAFFIINSIVACWYTEGLEHGEGHDLFEWAASWIPWAINIGVVTLFLYLRKYIALGWLLGLGILIALPVAATVACLSLAAADYVGSGIMDNEIVSQVCMALTALALLGGVIFGIYELVKTLMNQRQDEE